MSHEGKVKSNEWFTPKYIFDALCIEFDLDVAHPLDSHHTHVPAKRVLTVHEDGLASDWEGCVWMNPPFGNQKDKLIWINKFIEHGNGIALMPDRTSCYWWQYFAKRSHSILFVDKKIKFIRPDGSIGNQPSNGTTLFALETKAVRALANAERRGLGVSFIIEQNDF